MACKRDITHRADNDAWNHRTVRVGADDGFVHDFLCGEDNFFRGEGSFLLFADDAPQMRVAVCIRTLYMDDGDIRIERRNNDHILAAIGISDSLDVWVSLFEIGCTSLVHR